MLVYIFMGKGVEIGKDILESKRKRFHELYHEIYEIIRVISFYSCLIEKQH